MIPPAERYRSWCKCTLVSVVTAGLACTEPVESAPAVTVTQAAPRYTAPTSSTPRIDPFADLSVCRIEHQGPFLDLGQSGAPGLPAFRLQPKAGLHVETWQGQTHTQFQRRTATYEFWITEVIENPRVWLRAQAGSARRLSVGLDGRSLGTARAKISSFSTLRYSGYPKPLLPGRHRVTVRWRGRQRGTDPAYGLLRWIEIKSADLPVTAGRPPQHRALRSDVMLGGTVRQSLVIRSPTRVGCPILANPATVLQVGVGYWGTGSAVATISALRDGQAAVVLSERRVSGGPEAHFQQLAIPLKTLGSEPFHLQLSAVGNAGTGAVAFGEPALVAPEPLKQVPEATLAVVVLMGGLHQELLPPVSQHRLPHLARFASQNTRFSDYRVPSTRVGGVAASLFTALPPVEHGLHRRRMSMSNLTTTLPELVGAASGSSAFFTAVPQTRADFGFDQGWNRFRSYSPVDDIAASQPLIDAQRWLLTRLSTDADRKQLVVVHLRGAHPPWDLSGDELAALPPENYNGILEARRGGILLEGVRNRRRRSSRRLTNADWTRLRALQQHALSKQDLALGELFAKLRETSTWNDALVVIAGDVATDDPPEAPFGDGRKLLESRLTVPLWVKFPRAPNKAQLVPESVTTTDLSATLRRALRSNGVFSPANNDLYSLAQGILPAVRGPRVAVREDSYATRWGAWLLRGTSPSTPVLCHVDVDPACATDLRQSHPLLTEALWKKTYRTLVPPQKDTSADSPRPIRLTKPTAAALRVWGD